VQRVIDQQARRAARRAIADAVIDNDALTMDELRQGATALWQYWLSNAS
jgi:dephospho-CoA kinase